MEDYKKLVPIKSMEVRWNSTLFEIDRAIKLKPALMHFVSRLDAQYGPTSKTKAGQAARELRKRWELSEADWEALGYLQRILTVRDMIDMMIQVASTSNKSLRRFFTTLHSTSPNQTLQLYLTFYPSISTPRQSCAKL